VKVFNDIASFESERRTVVTIGTFDGVHLGHRQILSRVTQCAAKEGLASVLLTFFPHPRMILQRSHDLKLINTIQEKEQIIASVGIENLVIHPFTKDFSRLTAREYVEEILVKSLKAKKIIIGYDHRFGRNRTADINDLKEMAKEFSFDVEEISKQELEHVAISSTKIRTALQNGDIQLANDYLTTPFLLTGKVVKGKGLGRDFGYPTANLFIEANYKLIPAIGVYVVHSQIDGKQVEGVLSIGFNPTTGDNKLSIEVFFMDFSEDLYGKEVQLQLLKRIRGEKKFNSTDELIAAIDNDVLEAKSFLDVFN
jgi:riboflavin kinase/FMN adenylyltransferase